MPRTSNTSTIGGYITVTKPYDATQDQTTVTGASVKSRKQLTRSDITKRRKDGTGWRSPTDYDVVDYVSNAVTGNLTQDVTYSPSYARFNYKTDTTGCLTHLIGYLVTNQAPMIMPGQNDINRTIIEALVKVKDSKINLAQAMAEYRQTASLMSDQLARVMKAYGEVRKGKISKAFSTLGVRPKKLSKDTSQRWLELQYGWLPLLSDIHGGYEELTRPERPNGFRFKTTRQITIADSGNSSSPDGRLRYEWKSQARCKVVLWYSVDNAALLAASQVGLTNPATIAWELTPWSFVVDWIVPVGNLLEAMTATTGLNFVGGTITRTCSSQTTGIVVPWTETGAVNVSTKGTARGTATGFIMSRAALTRSPDIGPQNLYVKNPLSTTHALNALALFRGRLK